jgi:hypothetical protein
VKNFGFDLLGVKGLFVACGSSRMIFDLKKFDLVTSDIHLKGSSVLDLLQEIRKKATDTEEKLFF